TRCFRTVDLPLDRAVLSPSSPLLASDRGGLTGPNPIIKIGQEPLDDPGLTIIETDLHSSAPGSGLVRRSFAIGGQEKEGFLARQLVAIGRRLVLVLNGQEIRLRFQSL
ncbi:MAG: hypothetical protein JO266_01985, partial [Acidobacteria bacterium]|nr:hypothetical protein [Acidobacteriota bacterium]